MGLLFVLKQRFSNVGMESSTHKVKNVMMEINSLEMDAHPHAGKRVVLNVTKKSLMYALDHVGMVS